MESHCYKFLGSVTESHQYQRSVGAWRLASCIDVVVIEEGSCAIGILTFVSGIYREAVSSLVVSLPILSIPSACDCAITHSTSSSSSGGLFYHGNSCPLYSCLSFLSIALLILLAMSWNYYGVNSSWNGGENSS